MKYFFSVKTSAVVMMIALSAFFVTDGQALLGKKKNLDKFRLEGPVTTKADWSSTNLRWGKLNDDKKIDFMTVNNRKSIVEIYFQVDSELKPFEKKEWIIERQASDALILDLNGDGRDDILLASDPCRVMLQDKDGSFDKSVDLEFKAKYIFAVDLNDDKEKDIVAVGNDKLILAIKKDKKKPASFELIKKPSLHAPITRPLIGDLNNDGLDDLYFLSSTNRDHLIVRFRNSDNRFNPERSYKIGFITSYVSHDAGKQGAMLATIEDKTRTAKLLTLKDLEETSDKPFPFDDLLIIPFESKSSKSHYVIADLDKNKREEIYRFEPNAADMYQFVWTEQQSAKFKKYPTFSNIKKARFMPTAKGGQLVFLTPEEEAIGIVRPNGNERLAVPIPFDAGAKPLIFDVSDMDDDGHSDLVVGIEKDNKLGYFKADANGDFASTMTAIEIVGELKMEADPFDLLVDDVNQDKQADLIVFSEYAAPRIFVKQADGKYKSVLKDSGLQKGWFNQIRSKHFRLIDFDTDDNKEMVLLQKNYARVISLPPDGELKLLAQFNGEDAKSNLVGFAMTDITGDGKREVVLLDQGNKQLILYAADKPDAILRTVKMQNSDCLDLRTAEINGDGNEDLLVEGRGNIGILFRDKKQKTMESISRHTTEIEDGSYQSIASADLNGDGKNELILMENTKTILEFFEFKEPNKWNRFFHFKIFQGEGPAYGGRRMNPTQSLPRQYEVLDYNGDKKLDFVILIHDLIICYPRVK